MPIYSKRVVVSSLANIAKETSPSPQPTSNIDILPLSIAGRNLVCFPSRISRLCTAAKRSGRSLLQVWWYCNASQYREVLQSSRKLNQNDPLKCGREESHVNVFLFQP